MRAEEPLNDEPADQADGSRDLWGSVRSVPSPSGSTSYNQTSVPAKARWADGVAAVRLCLRNHIRSTAFGRGLGMVALMVA